MPEATENDLLDTLNPRQRLFVEGLAKGMHDVDAYKAAGYKAKGIAARSGAARLRTNANVCAALAALQSSTEDIADRAERQQFWTAVMRDAGEDMRHRLKAAELLGKAGADFVERREVEHKGAMPVVVLPSNGREGG